MIMMMMMMIIIIIIAERAADAAACRVTSDAEMLMLCKDAGKRSQCLRCMRERITGRLRYGQ